MEAIQLEAIFQSFGTLGMGGIFLYLYFRERGESQIQIKEKDDRIKEMTQQLISSYNENVKVQENVKNAIIDNREVIKNSLTLTQRIYEELISHDNSNSKDS